MPRYTRKRAADQSQSEDTKIVKLTSPASVDNSIENIVHNFEVPYLNKNIFCTLYGSPTAQLSMIFTHGAGGDLSSPAVANFAKGFSELKKIICFQGNMNLTSRTKMYKAVIVYQNGCNALGGRSLGARAAIMTAKETENVKALILVSYPLRNQKGDLRNQILLEIDENIDVLFVIGDKDSMCDIDELKMLTKKMKAKTWILVVKNANHGMDIRPQKATDVVGRMVGRIAAGWLEERNENLTNCQIQWNDEQGEVDVSSWSDLL